MAGVVYFITVTMHYRIVVFTEPRKNRTHCNFSILIHKSLLLNAPLKIESANSNFFFLHFKKSNFLFSTKLFQNFFFSKKILNLPTGNFFFYTLKNAIFFSRPNFSRIFFWDFFFSKFFLNLFFLAP